MWRCARINALPARRMVVVVVAVVVTTIAVGEVESLVTPRSGSVTSTSTVSTVNDIETYVKNLEYEVSGGGSGGGKGGSLVDLNQASDDQLSEAILLGFVEELQAVDREQNDTKLEENPPPEDKPRSRQLSLIYQGVYAPDSRFNAFVDGVMVNMVAEMKRKRMDPLYFRVYDRGVVEHVSTRGSRGNSDAETASSSSNRNGRERGSAIGGGVIRGLTNVKRFGNAEVQIAGNTTLVRSHYIYGPLNVELLFTTQDGVKSVNSTLSALAAHAVTHLNDSTSKLLDFLIDSPAHYEINLVGERSERYDRLSHSAVSRLFKPSGRLERRLFRVFKRARSRRIPDVRARQSRRRGGGGGGGRTSEPSNQGTSENSTTTAAATPEIP